MQGLKRTAFSGPALVRLLAHFADLDVREPAQSLSDRLSQWLGWTDAIALSTALASDPPAVSGARSTASDEEAASARTRTRLANAVTRDENSEKDMRGRHRAAVQTPPDDMRIDYAIFRQHYLSLQQTMESDIGELRNRLRAAVAARSTDMTRLAVVDAVMEQTFAARERSLLAQVPVLLGRHFERLKRAHAQRVEASEASSDAAPPAPGAWLTAFRKDMQSVLLAELEVRFQPVEGLLAALRTQ
ncbi:DUF3348 domain-containing protein [Caballeronia ptereochthonis]|uniref:DUF3348 domain-containing protein n=1 Tax=Caballeronia ptereochthonis TaxID=1777144 RepID=A0A158B9T0_9BURK|nr:DUF3348 domain-containing protein [Caballeronia ptereochthonis]SAK66793.1 hypothetical protein AWB83_02998 [Caballeronia ptereochthonis]